MPDPQYVNAQVIDIINQAQTATMSHQNVMTAGAGKAYQSVAQSSAIAVQDATDALRNITTIATSAAGIAMAQFLATKDKDYLPILAAAQQMLTSATDDYQKIGTTAANILKDFPAG
jgi:hypothetical protein